MDDEALPSQRALFEIPPDVAYLDAAAYSPLPRAVRAAGEAGVATKSAPWTHPRDLNDRWAARARAAAARLIGAAPGDVAIVGAVSYAIATAAQALDPPRGSRVLLMQDEFPSLALVWQRVAAARDLVVETVPRPDDGDWTAALLEAIGRPGALPLSVAALTPLHWSDGAVVRLDVLAPAIRAAGAALVVDATQAAGVLSIDVAALRPDFLAFPTYKWTLGPYSMAFLYAAPHRQSGMSLEAHGTNHPNGLPAPGAARYDRGERNDPVALPMAATGLELVGAWGTAAISARLAGLTARLAAGLDERGLASLPADRRAPHILGIRLPGGMRADLIRRLAAQGAYASDRLGVLRISPHVWVEEADVDRFVEVLARCLRG